MARAKPIQWEKRLSVGALQAWRPKDLRKRQASEVTMSAEELQKLISALVRRRMRGKQPPLVVEGVRPSCLERLTSGNDS